MGGRQVKGGGGQFKEGGGRRETMSKRAGIAKEGQWKMGNQAQESGDR